MIEMTFFFFIFSNFMKNSSFYFPIPQLKKNEIKSAKYDVVNENIFLFLNKDLERENFF